MTWRGKSAPCQVRRLDDVSLGLIESFRGNDGSWHLSFRHLAHLPSVPDLRPAPDVEAAE